MAKPGKGMGKYDILAEGSRQTRGLSGKSAIKLKGLKDYSIAVQPGVEARLVSTSRSAASLEDSLHPGMNVEPGISLKGAVLSGKELERICFRQSTLTKVDFRDCQLRGARFKGCDLSGADFRGAILKDCLFEDSNLDGADLRGCQLDDARIVDCNLFAVNFDKSRLDNAIIDSCTMGAQSFYGSSCLGMKLYNSQIIHGFFDEADLTGSELRNMLFKNCTLSNTHFDNSLLDDCQFKGCDSSQDGPIFSGGSLNNILMMDCEFQVPKLVHTQISNSVLSRVDLESALLEGTCFNQVVFESGELKECYSLEESPTFNRCRMDHVTIDQAEWSNARFDKSSFVGALIRDSDFNSWVMNHTGLDGETSVEWESD